ncbi:MAG: ribbon-helix-helix domain-containing protein [Acidobacteria bacterium]|nr:ribbon-helix-helix domain-containing protein [Acidobacteriota bacterium]
MKTAKIAITIDEDLLRRLDHATQRYAFRSRSRAIQEAVRDKLDRLDRTLLARECAKLDPRQEQRLAEEGMEHELEKWPEY